MRFALCGWNGGSLDGHEGNCLVCSLGIFLWKRFCGGNLRFGVRYGFGKSPGFTAVAVLTLALGIGANTAIFSLTDQIFAARIARAAPGAAFHLALAGSESRAHLGRCGSRPRKSFSYLMYKDLRERADCVFPACWRAARTTVNVSGHGETQAAHADLVSGNFFETLEVQPALGRLFMPGR